MIVNTNINSLKKYTDVKTFILRDINNPVIILY